MSKHKMKLTKPRCPALREFLPLREIFLAPEHSHVPEPFYVLEHSHVPELSHVLTSPMVRGAGYFRETGLNREGSAKHLGFTGQPLQQDQHGAGGGDPLHTRADQCLLFLSLSRMFPSPPDGQRCLHSCLVGHRCLNCSPVSTPHLALQQDSSRASYGRRGAGGEREEEPKVAGKRYYPPPPDYLRFPGGDVQQHWS